MGVIGASCQLCRLPLQHDHYVPMLGEQMLRIYRGGDPQTDWKPGERVVKFHPEHAWLAEAVAVLPDGTVTAGPVEDGVLHDTATGETVFIWEGDDEGLAYHRYCWELLGTPLTGHGSHDWAIAERYAGQLFEMWEFVAHGKGWALADPRSNRRSRERIERIAAAARRPPPGQATTVADVIASDRGWRGTMQRTAEHEAKHALLFRADAHPALADLTAYPALVWAMKEYAPGGGLPDAAQFDELEQFAVAVRGAVEADNAALLLMTTIGGGQQQLIIQARDEAATRKAIEALPGGSIALEFDNSVDAKWSIFFEKMRPRG